MVTIADALRDQRRQLPGDNSTSTLQLVLFLRAATSSSGTTRRRRLRPGPEELIEGALDAFSRPRARRRQ
ncbi:M9 family metallopeptidase N-terminal domain-containing protein [Kitasatospora albolonga]|uniref:M9 family metallopeptidase N-terminal domain-containing protein n=1 Tax=Kitasatospora albolonga TaxID=68173 RepID=UPI003CD073AA